MVNFNSNESLKEVYTIHICKTISAELNKQK